FKGAFAYGADAVFVGSHAYALRRRSENCPMDDRREGSQFAHERGVNVHVAANMVTHEGNEAGAGAWFRELRYMGLDAVIEYDPALMVICLTEAPGLEVHVSTQASTTNYESFAFWKEIGVTRVVLAREVSIAEIEEIRQHTDLEIEAFV